MSVNTNGDAKVLAGHRREQRARGPSPSRRRRRRHGDRHGPQAEGLADLVAAHPDRIEAIALTSPTASGSTRWPPTSRLATAGVDVLVNNAGRTQVGAFEETTDASSATSSRCTSSARHG